MKSKLLLWLLLLCAHSAWAQTLQMPVQETFETDGEGTRYTSSDFYLSTTQYFFRAALPGTPGGTAPNFGGTALSGTQGSYFWACEGVKGNTSTNQRNGRNVTLKPIDVSGYTDVKIEVAFADPRGSAASNLTRAVDFMKVQYRYGDTTGTFTDAIVFTKDPNVGGPTGTSKWTKQGTSIILTPAFSDHNATHSPPTGQTALYVRVLADFNFSNTEIAFDNIRVTGTISSVQKPTIVSNNGTSTLTFAEGTATPLPVFDNLTVGNPAMSSNPTVSGATVTISALSYAGAQDVLSYNTARVGGSTGISFVSNTGGVLTFSGSAPVANYKALLESVAYKNTDVNNATAGDRTFNFVVRDGSTNSNPLTRVITVTTALNAATPPPRTETFDSDGEGTRYGSNTLNQPNQGFLRLEGVSGGSHSPGATYASTATFTNLQGTGYWYSNGSAAILTGGVGRVMLAPVNTTGFVDLRFKIKAGTNNTTIFGTTDFLRFSYSLDGSTNWTVFTNYTGVSGKLRLDGISTNPGLGAALTDLDIALPAGATGPNVYFRVETASSGGEEIVFDNIQITGNAPPVISSQTRSVAENSANGTNVGAVVTASDPDGNALTYAITAGNTGGTFAINSATGQITVANSGALNFEVTPTYNLTVQVTDNAATPASSSATVTVNVTNVNEAPVAVNDNISVNEDSGPTVVNVLANDTDPDAGTTLTVTAVTQPANGTVTFTSSNVSFTPAANFNGTTSFTYTISDGALTATATVNVTVTAVNDAPVVTTTGGTTTFITGGGAVAIDNGLTVTDADNTTLASATVSITSGLQSGFDVLSFSNTNTTTFGNIGTAASSNGTLPLSSSGNTATLAQWQAALRAVTFNNSNPTGTSRTVSFVANDGTTASAAATKIITIAAPTTVVSVTRLNPSPTATTQVRYQVVFSRSVTGVTVSNFAATSPSGTVTITGTGISSVVGSGTTYTVTVNTGTGDGTLRLNVNNSANITPTVSGLPFNGEVYTITRSFAAQPQLTIVGTGGQGSDVTAFVDVVQVLSGGTAFTNALQNGSFETHGPYNNGGNTFSYGTSGAVWAFNAQAGIADQGSAFTPVTPIPNGIAVAFVQSNSGGNGQLQQNLALPTGSNYQVNFQAAQRICCTTLDQSLNVFLNGVYFGNIQPNENSYTAFTSPTFSVTAPALTATLTSATAANGGSTSTSPIAYTVTFSQAVTGFDATDVSVSNGTVSGFSGSGTTYTFNVTPAASGAVTVNVPANSAVDANNTGNTAATTYTITYTQPATAAPVITSPTNGTLTNQAVVISGTAPAGSDVTVYLSQNGGAFVSLGTYTATGGTFSTPAFPFPSTTYQVYATAQSPGAAVSANSATISFTVDTVQPTVAITSSAAASGGTTTTSPIPFTVTFSETVNGSFVQGDLSVTGGSVSGFTTVTAGTTFTFNVTPSGNGVVTVNVPANVAQDNAGNFNTAAPTYTITYTQPVTAAPVLTAPANNSSVPTTTPTYSGTAVDNSTVTVYVDGSAVGTTTATGGSFSLAQPSALSQGSHTVFARAQSAGQTQSANSNTNTFTVDTVPPTVTITSPIAPDGGYTTTAPLTYVLTFSENVSSPTVSVTNFGGGSLTRTSASTFAVSVTPGGPGTVRVSVNANSATDAAGNGSPAASYTIFYNVPTTAPVLTSPANNSTLANGLPTYAGTAPAGSTVTVYVNGTSIGTTTATGTGSFSLTQPTALPAGTYSVYATALATGQTVSANSATTTFTVDTSRPSVAITSTAGASGGTTGTSPIPFTVTFSENVTGFVAGDVTVTNGTITSGVVNGTSPGSIYTFTVTPNTAGTATTVNVPNNVAVDAAGNGNTAAIYSLTFTALTVMVNPASLPNGTVGVAYSQALTALGGSGTYTYSLTGALPNGLSLTGGTISGTPTASGTFNFRITATDNSAAPGPYSGFRDYVVTIARPAITVAPASLPGGTVGMAYSQTLTASGGSGAYTYAITAGATPNGLAISQSGVLSGTPTAAGTFNFTVTATDAFGSTGSQAYTVAIAAPTITLAPTTLPNGTQGSAYSQTLTASGGTGAYTYAITAGALPTGVTLTGGTIAGTPTVNGTFNFTVTATDAFGSTGSQAYSLVIAAPVVTATSWTGAISTDWFTAGNWTAGVPNSTIDATIPASAPNMPLIAFGTASARNLTLNSGASVTQNGGTLQLAANLTNNGTFTAAGGTVVLGTSTLASILGSSNTRFWNLTVQANGAQSSTSASTSVQRVLTLTGNFTTNGNPLTLESNATTTAMVVNNGSNAVSGNVTVQRYITPDLNPNLGYRHFSPAISTATVGSLTTASFTPVVNPAYNSSATPGSVTPFPTVYGYDQARLTTSPATTLSTFDKGWFSPTSTADQLAVGQGYTVLARANQTWSLTGPLNNGPITLPLARNAGATAADAGYAFIGNPYPSPLDWSLVDDAARPNVGATMYVYRSDNPANPYSGTYGFYQNGIGTISPVVAQGQGFFVRVNVGQTAGSVTFNNGLRPTSYTNPTYHRTTETRPVVELHLQGTGSTLNDAAFVYFEQGATDSFDTQYDAEKLANPSGLNLSTSLSATQRLAIDGRAPLGTAQRIVPLAVGVPTAGSYTLSAAQVLNLGTTPVYLRDLLTGAVVDLQAQPSYSFTVSNASALLTARFELVFSPQAPLATATAALAAQVGLYPNPASKAVFVELPAVLGHKAVSAALVDALGRVVLTQALPAGLTTHTLPLTNVATGVYSLRLQTSAGVIVKKLVVE